VLGLIPARGGSKGLPRKNILPLLGKPLIAWTVEEGRASRYVDRLVVSTDDTDIAEAARKAGAEVPFMRPSRLANDTASSMDVIDHALAELQNKPDRYDYLLLLEPTSPLREPSDIDICIERLIAHTVAKSIVSVAALESSHPDFNMTIDSETECLRKTQPVDFTKSVRRQDLKDIYFFEGSVYLSEIDTLLKERTFYHDRTLAHIVPRWKSLEIDEIQDLICAEALLKARKEGRF